MDGWVAVPRCARAERRGAVTGSVPSSADRPSTGPVRARRRLAEAPAARRALRRALGDTRDSSLHEPRCVSPSFPTA